MLRRWDWQLVDERMELKYLPVLKPIDGAMLFVTPL